MNMWSAHNLLSIMKKETKKSSLIKFIKAALDVEKQKQIKGGNIIIEEVQSM